MSAPRRKSAPQGYRMLLEPDALQALLDALAASGVTSFSYEDAKVKLEIVRGAAHSDAKSSVHDDSPDA